MEMYKKYIEEVSTFCTIATGMYWPDIQSALGVPP